MVSACCGPSRTADKAKTSAQVLKRNSRISSRTGMSRSIVRSSIVYWMARVSLCSTCWATLTRREVACFSVKNLDRNFSNSSYTSWKTRRPVSGYCSMTCTTRRISASSALPLMVVALKPITHAPMRSISLRAGWSRLLKNSGSANATRSTGTCRRANHTRTAGGIRSSARMLWNIRATTSMMAFSPAVLAFFLSSVDRSRTLPTSCTTAAGL
ncbi:hypothetical protein D3C71_1610460 [compost metagenome]